MDLDALKHYSQQMAGVMLPYLNNRPLTVQCFPGGVAGDSLFFNNVEAFPAHFRACLEGQAAKPSVQAPTQGPILCHTPETLIGLIEACCYCLLMEATTLNTPNQVDWLVLQVAIHPHTGSAMLAETLTALAAIAENRCGHPGVLKISGEGQVDWLCPTSLSGPAMTHEAALRLGFELATQLSEQLPRRIEVQESTTTVMGKGKVYLSLSANHPHRGVVVPYGLWQPAQGWVSCPVTLAEVGQWEQLPQFAIGEISQRLETHGDLWKGLLYPRL